jgi:hypothetical protein
VVAELWLKQSEVGSRIVSPDVGPRLRIRSSINRKAAGSESSDSRSLSVTIRRDIVASRDSGDLVWFVGAEREL